MEMQFVVQRANGVHFWRYVDEFKRKIVVRTMKMYYSRDQERFLKYHRGRTCENCKCSNLGGCNCLWKRGCMKDVCFDRY